MLTSKQRAFLRALAAEEDTILMIGKSGMNENIVAQADGALEVRELLKGKVLENAPITNRIAAEELAAKTGSEVVQVIGRKFVLYRRKKDRKSVV